MLSAATCVFAGSTGTVAGVDAGVNGSSSTGVVLAVSVPGTAAGTGAAPRVVTPESTAQAAPTSAHAMATAHQRNLIMEGSVGRSLMRLACSSRCGETPGQLGDLVLLRLDD